MFEISIVEIRKIVPSYKNRAELKNKNIRKCLPAVKIGTKICYATDINSSDSKSMGDQY